VIPDILYPLQTKSQVRKDSEETIR